MRPRHDDRFVLIGLCWLYGRSEFPPFLLLISIQPKLHLGFGMEGETWLSISVGRGCDCVRTSDGGRRMLPKHSNDAQGEARMMVPAQSGVVTSRQHAH